MTALVVPCLADNGKGDSHVLVRCFQDGSYDSQETLSTETYPFLGKAIPQTSAPRSFNFYFLCNSSLVYLIVLSVIVPRTHLVYFVCSKQVLCVLILL